DRRCRAPVVRARRAGGCLAGLAAKDVERSPRSLLRRHEAGQRLEAGWRAGAAVLDPLRCPAGFYEAAFLGVAHGMGQSAGIELKNASISATVTLTTPAGA